MLKSPNRRACRPSRRSLNQSTEVDQGDEESDGLEEWIGEGFPDGLENERDEGEDVGGDGAETDEDVHVDLVEVDDGTKGAGDDGVADDLDESRKDDRRDSVRELTRWKRSPSKDEDGDAQDDGREGVKTDSTKVLSDSILCSLESGDGEELRSVRFEFRENVSRVTSSLSLGFERDLVESSEVGSLASVELVQNVRGRDPAELERKRDLGDGSSSFDSSSDGLDLESCCAREVGGDGSGTNGFRVVDEVRDS